VVLVAASGNHGGVFGNGSDEVNAPAACDGVISVGAFDSEAGDGATAAENFIIRMWCNN
jgi:hypothetical protein